MFSVTLLGTFSVFLDHSRVTAELGPGGRILAGYLFEFPNKVHRREKLADQFWGHLDPYHARAALNTALWRLRKLLSHEPLSRGGMNLRSIGFEVVLEPAAWLDIDTHRFGSCVRQALDPDCCPPDLRLSLLKSADGIYGGPFMDGDDADWILEERERLHSIYVKAASELVRIYGCRREFDEGIETARRILSVDPFRESVHRDLAVLLVLSGQRVAALRHYRRLREMFRTELGIEPMPETLELGQEIQSGLIFNRSDSLIDEYFLKKPLRK